VNAVYDPQLEQRLRQHRTEQRQTVTPHAVPRGSANREPYGYD
jgi:hypothetical protein